MTTLQVVAVQQPVRRGHEHVRVFGYDITDPRKRIVEVAVSIGEAVAMIALAEQTHEFPQVEVPDNAWIFCLNTGNMEMVHIEHGKPTA